MQTARGANVCALCVLQREAERRADAEDRAIDEGRRAERAEHAATAADLRASEVAHELAATRQAMVDARAEQGQQQLVKTIMPLEEVKGRNLVTNLH